MPHLARFKRTRTRAIVALEATFLYHYNLFYVTVSLTRVWRFDRSRGLCILEGFLG